MLASWLALALLLVAPGCGDDDGAVGDTSLGDAADTSTPEAGDTAAPDTMVEVGEAEVAVDAGQEIVGETVDEVVDPVGTLTVMTYNVMCSFCDNDSAYDPWEVRLEYFQDIMDRYAPDLVGVQELTFVEEVEQMKAMLPGFEAVYYISQTTMDYPDATILYDAERFELVEQGFYWLSPTPDVPYSTGFSEGPQFFRIVAWALLEQKADGRRIYFATTHFDNNSPSQDLSAPLVLERSEPQAAEHPFILNGDFNSQTFDPAFATLVEGVDGQGFHFDDTWAQAATWEVISNQDPAPTYDEPGRIDHIFTAGGTFQVDAWYVDMTIYGELQQYPSDHWPIVSVIHLPE